VINNKGKVQQGPRGSGELPSLIEWISPRGHAYEVELTRQLDPPPEGTDRSPRESTTLETSLAWLLA
jgi:hypothetical protein